MNEFQTLSRRCLEGSVRRKARVHIPGQAFERNMKKINISWAISSQQISGKNSDSELKLS